MANDIPKAKANATMKLIYVNDEPRLCLFAHKDIPIGDEICYDYGVSDLPWRKKVGILAMIELIWVNMFNFGFQNHHFKVNCSSNRKKSLLSVKLSEDDLMRA